MTHQDELFFAVKQYLQSQNWKFEEDQEKYLFRYGMSIRSKLSTCRMVVDVKEKGIVFYAICPLKAQEDSRPAVAEYITRANYGLLAGNFEMDYSDGEVRYKNFVRSSTTIPSQDEIEFDNDVCFSMMRRYGDGLVKNMMGFGNPEADIREAES